MKHTHREVQELLGVYALDALDPDERLAVEAHLVDCPQCRSEVEGHRAVAAMLGNAGASSAPDALWDRIADSLEGDSGDDPRQVIAFPLGTPEAGSAPTAPAAPRRAGRRGRAPVGVILASVAAATILIVGLMGVRTIRHQQDRVEDLAQQVAAADAQRSATDALSDPNSTIVRLTSPGDDLELRAVVTDDGVGYLLGDSLPDLGQASTYQLWGATASQTVSLGVLGNKPGLFEFHLDDPVTALAITREAAGGVEHSDKEPLVSGPLSETTDETTLTS